MQLQKSVRLLVRAIRNFSSLCQVRFDDRGEDEMISMICLSGMLFVIICELAAIYEAINGGHENEK